MSTMLRKTKAGYLISTLVSPGNRKRLPRGPVLIPKGDREALQEEIMRQATKARADMGLKTD